MMLYSPLLRLGKQFLETAEAIGTAMGIYFTVNNIREVRNQENEGTNQDTPSRFNFKNLSIIAFFLFHMFALVLAAGVCGEFILSASMANLLVSATSLFNDLYEFICEWYQDRHRKRQLANKEREYASFNMHFDQNNLFIKDFLELRDEIEILSLQQEECVLLNSQLDEAACDTANVNGNLIIIANMLKEKSDSILTEETVINHYYEKYGRNLDESKIVREIEIKAKLIKQRTKEIRVAMQALIDQGFEHSYQVAQYQQDLSSLDRKIIKLDILSRHFYEINKAKTALEDINNQLENLDEKYTKQPFNEYADDERRQIKTLERHYLLQRHRALSDFIDQPVKPIPASARSARFDIRQNAQEALELLRNQQDIESLKRILTNYIKSIDHMIEKKSAEFNEKRKFLENITNDPKQQTRVDLDKILTTGKNIIDLKSQIKLAEKEKSNKLWSTNISILSACVSIVLTFFSHRIHLQAFEGLSKALSIFGTVNSLWATQVSLRAKRESENEAQIEINNLANDCSERSKLISDPNLRTDCDGLIQSFRQKLDTQYPIGAANDGLSPRRIYLPKKSTSVQTQQRKQWSPTKETKSKFGR
ncbi:MAG: hypothetical protein JSR17_07190 [Proteobacteria bacterium]|nr:hypothetical protein [Pseudomonadota bacterium]